MASSPSSSLLQASLLVQLQLAIDLLVDKMEYLTAVSVAPHLVLTESAPLRFLQFTGGNPAAAAQGLVRYWKRRVEIFGPDRAFLPLSLSGNGALSNQDIEYIQTGLCVIVPEGDATGRTVICYQNSRRIENNPDVRMRAAFFYGHMVAENPLSQTEGYISMVLLTQPEIDPVMHKIQAMLFDTFPTKAKAFHVFNCLPAWDEENWLYRGFLTFMMRTFGHVFQRFQTYIHFNKDQLETLESMKSHGIPKHMLPERIGGTWRYEEFFDWMEERTRQERFPAGTLPSLVGAVGAVTNSQQVLPGAFGSQTRGTCTNGNNSNSSDNSDRDIQKHNKYLLACHRHLYQARQHLETSSPYTKALDKSKVWQEGCRLTDFLRTEYYHAKYTHLRLCRYWTLRSDTFGASRMFDGLDQTGEAALRRKELAALETGFVKLLPNDAFDCSVLCIQNTREPEEESSRDARERCIFYMCSLLAENPKSQTEGAVLLVRLNGETEGFFQHLAAYLKRISHAFPLRFKAVHLLSFSRIPGSLDSKFQNIGVQTFAHVANTKEELLSQLAVHGLNKDCLPNCVNGNFGYEMFVHWQDLRTRNEWNIPLGRSWKASSNTIYPAIRTNGNLLEESPERRRRLDVMHSRRKRGRVRVEAFLLKEQCDELRDVQQNLRQENDRLEDLMQKAAAATVDNDLD